MSFDLDKKEFDEAIQDKNYEFIWSAYESLREELIIQRDLVDEVIELEKENKNLKQCNQKQAKELARIQRLPYMDKARASAVIMQVAAQLTKMPEDKKAKQLQEAVDLWATYTARVEAERDQLKEKLEVVSKIAYRDMKAKMEMDTAAHGSSETIKEQDGGWFWADEVWEWHGPCSSRESAQKRQSLYAED